MKTRVSIKKKKYIITVTGGAEKASLLSKQVVGRNMDVALRVERYNT